ncbi:hypothetical protein ACFQH6_19770 [Halobacteriaceae archaeon GCM10025711]
MPIGTLWSQYSSWIWVLLAAGLFFLLGMLDGVPAALAAAITGALFWWVLIERPSKPTYRQGAWFGFLAQLTAYPVIYLLSGFLGLPAGADETYPAFTYGGSIPSGAELIDILSGMVIWVGFHLPGVLITGPIGVAAGLVLVALRRRSHSF